MGHKAAAKEIVDKEKQKKRARLKIADAAEKRAETLYNKATGKEKEAKAALEQIMNLPSNTAYGEQPAYKGELRLLSGDTWKMESFIKFPTTTLDKMDTIMMANLRVFKAAGGSGTINVHTASCGWSRKDLTWTGAEVYPGGLTLLSAGAQQEVVGEGDVDKPKWVDIKLKAHAVQANRVYQGTHICVKISGGPSDGYSTFASEDTENKPQLKLYVKSGGSDLHKAMHAAKNAAAAAEAKKIRARGEFRLRKIDALTKSYSEKYVAKKSRSCKA